jgi:hypothetical protein
VYKGMSLKRDALRLLGYTTDFRVAWKLGSGVLRGTYNEEISNLKISII